MRKAIYILFFWLGLFGLNLSTVTAGSSYSVKKESRFVLPIVIEPTIYEEFKEDKAYNYYDTRIEDDSFWEQMKKEFSRWFRRTISPDITDEQVNIGFWIAFVVIFLFIIWVVIRYNPSFFYINRKNTIGFQIENENIHTLNFDELIKEALKSEHYVEAIRWDYLQTLKALHEKELLHWDTNKTANEYVYELSRPELKPDFKLLTQQFTYYRYGNGIASEEVFRQIAGLSNKITNRL